MKSGGSAWVKFCIRGESLLERCSECGVTLLPGELVTVWNRKILAALSKVRRPLRPEEIRFALSVIPYGQSDLAKAMSVERSTITRYKNGSNPLAGPADHLFRQFLEEFSEGREELFKRFSELAEHSAPEDVEFTITSVAAKSA